jgi:acetylornithine deacetylase/succinyl-diaminopimelate desuccinylase-like protein
VDLHAGIAAILRDRLGAAEDHVHSPDEKVSLQDLESMVHVYQYLLKEL